MAQDKGKKEETSPTGETEEKQPLSPEEEASALRQQAEEAVARAEKAEAEAKAHQKAAFQASRERDEALKGRVTPEDLDAIRADQRVMAGMMAEWFNQPNIGELEPDKRQDYVKRFQEESAKEKAKAEMAKRQREAGELAEKINSYQIKVEELGVKPAEKIYKQIRAYVLAGDFESADEEIETIRAKSAEKPEKETKETPGEHDKRIKEEAKREALIEAGVLTSEGGEPSATTPKGFAKIEQDYIDGKISFEEYSKARKAEGLD